MFGGDKINFLIPIVLPVSARGFTLLFGIVCARCAYFLFFYQTLIEFGGR